MGVLGGTPRLQSSVLGGLGQHQGAAELCRGPGGHPRAQWCSVLGEGGEGGWRGHSWALCSSMLGEGVLGVALGPCTEGGVLGAPQVPWSSLLGGAPGPPHCSVL